MRQMAKGGTSPPSDKRRELHPALANAVRGGRLNLHNQSLRDFACPLSLLAQRKWTESPPLRIPLSGRIRRAGKGAGIPACHIRSTGAGRATRKPNVRLPAVHAISIGAAREYRHHRNRKARTVLPPLNPLAIPIPPHHRYVSQLSSRCGCTLDILSETEHSRIDGHIL
jgi:hypothetical protein